MIAEFNSQYNMRRDVLDVPRAALDDVLQWEECRPEPVDILRCGTYMCGRTARWVAPRESSGRYDTERMFRTCVECIRKQPAGFGLDKMTYGVPWWLSLPAYLSTAAGADEVRHHLHKLGRNASGPALWRINNYLQQFNMPRLFTHIEAAPEEEEIVP
jgi:hypothetical protein